MTSRERVDRVECKLIWATPNGDQVIGDLARVSAPENQGKEASKLIEYLLRNQHWSPLEMANMVVEINTTRDIARQLLRHRSFSFQEFSQRYADVSKLEKPPLREARLQDSKNRQNSIETDNLQLHYSWENIQKRVIKAAEEAYEWALDRGIAKEVARAVLPEGLTSSRLYMNGTVRSWVHWYQLRSGNGTQKEHMQIAEAIGLLLQEQFPSIWNALVSIQPQ